MNPPTIEQAKEWLRERLLTYKARSYVAVILDHITRLEAENARLKGMPFNSEAVRAVVYGERIDALTAALAAAQENERRLDAMLPLFEEARDAICAIPLASAKLRGIRLDLGDRMDEVGVPAKWKAKLAALKGANNE